MWVALPWVQARAENREEVTAFYEDLDKEVRKQQRTSAIEIIVGDYNSIIGKREETEDDSIVGRYTKGKRNKQGQYTRDHLMQTDIFFGKHSLQT